MEVSKQPEDPAALAPKKRGTDWGDGVDKISYI
jgi:hypothetical protein